MRSLAAILGLFLVSASARAEWNDGVDVYKVFLGAYPDPGAYYVMLDVSEGDNFILDSKLLIYGPGAGGLDDPPEVLVLYDHVPSGHLALIANDAAESLFDVEADLQLELPLRREGGKICFEGRGGFDCVAWGDYAGPAEGVGTPFNAPVPPELSTSIVRKQPGPVEDSSEDFIAGDPWPTNIHEETGFTRLIYCGNRFVDEGEECDHAEDNSNFEPDACRSDCTLPRCGDGVVDAGEECDQGNDGADSEVEECRADCTLSRCGDGIVDLGEQCDDGNDLDTDACLNACVPATCGDGFVQAEVEECDDGNTAPGDGCAADCATEAPPAGERGGGCHAAGVSPSANVAWALALVLWARRRSRTRHREGQESV